jgi:hypothetical protein
VQANTAARRHHSIDCLDNVRTVTQRDVAADIEEILALTIRSLSLCPSSHIFVDGVDELSKRNQRLILKSQWALVEACNKPELMIRVHLSFREVPSHILKTPQEWTRVSIRTMENLIDSDIARYVQFAVMAAIKTEELMLGDPALAIEIIQSLTQCSKGM